jgi:hypothetical protein
VASFGWGQAGDLAFLTPVWAAPADDVKWRASTALRVSGRIAIVETSRIAVVRFRPNCRADVVKRDRRGRMLGRQNEA